MKNIKLFNIDSERTQYEDGLNYLEPYVSYVEEDNTVHYNKPPFFCKLTLSDDSVVEIEGSGELTRVMTQQYLSSVVNAEIGTLCTNIGNSAFEWYGSVLSSVTIPDSVTSIGEEAFYGCSSLTSIIIPNSVTSIDSDAFYNCRGLTSVTVEATTPPTLGNGVFSSTDDCPIYVPSESVDVYKAALKWSNYADRIQAIQE